MLGSSLKTRFYLIAALLVSLIVIPFGVYLNQQAKLSQHFLELEAHNDDIDHINELYVHLLNLETGQRGYLLTGDEAYLEPYNLSLATISQAFAVLDLDLDRHLNVGNEHQGELSHSLGELKRLFLLKAAVLEETIDLKRKGGSVKALNIVRSDRGKMYMDEMRGHLDVLISNELTEITRTKSDYIKSASNAEFLLLVVSIIGLMVVVSVIYFFNTVVIKPIVGISDRLRAISKGEAVDLASLPQSKFEIAQLQLALQNFNEVKQKNDQLTESVKREQQAGLAKSEFLSTMSHEIRTPLNSIIGFSQVLLQNPENKDSIYVKNIYRSGKHLLGLIGDILDLNKLEVGKKELVVTPFPLDALLDDCFEAYTVIAQAKSIDFELNNLCVENHWLEGDVTAIKQILFNMLDNAVKFTDEGGVTFTINCAPLSPDKMALKFVVSDTGKGISEAGLAHIFDAYKQEDGSISRKFGGTAGLGLNISYKLAELMNGRLSVTSKVAEGTEFIFEVTLSESDPVTEIVDHEALNGDGKLSILAVDDVAVNLLVVKALLGKTDHIVETATSGKEALDMVNTSEAFDLILMDIHMPEMDGIQTMKKIRQLPDLVKATMPIFALTADVEATHRESYLESGMDGVIAKPIDMNELQIVLAGLNSQS
jgi:signal transduction histidine kinase/ActR/RegA family two-component response regulator